MQRRQWGKASLFSQLEAAPGETLRQTIQLTESPEAQLKTPAGAAEATLSNTSAVGSRVMARIQESAALTINTL